MHALTAVFEDLMLDVTGPSAMLLCGVFEVFEVFRRIGLVLCQIHCYIPACCAEGVRGV